MSMALYTAIGLGSALALAGMPAAGSSAPGARAAADTAATASKLIGKWTGTRTDSSSSGKQQFTMVWKKTADGHLAGTVRLADGSSYPTNVVWSSDTALITESAPHQSRELKEEVVTRTVDHVKGNSIDGRFELRPTHYKGRTVTGQFTAHKG
jgi:hypothetical protein